MLLYGGEEVERPGSGVSPASPGAQATPSQGQPKQKKINSIYKKKRKDKFQITSVKVKFSPLSFDHFNLIL